MARSPELRPGRPSCERRRRHGERPRHHGDVFASPVTAGAMGLVDSRTSAPAIPDINEPTRIPSFASSRRRGCTRVGEPGDEQRDREADAGDASKRRRASEPTRRLASARTRGAPPPTVNRKMPGLLAQEEPSAVPSGRGLVSSASVDARQRDPRVRQSEQRHDPERHPGVQQVHEAVERRLAVLERSSMCEHLRVAHRLVPGSAKQPRMYADSSVSTSRAGLRRPGRDEHARAPRPAMVAWMPPWCSVYQSATPPQRVDGAVAARRCGCTPRRAHRSRPRATSSHSTCSPVP